MTNFYAETDVALNALSNANNGLVEAATGTGKGVLIERDVVSYIQQNSGTVIIVGHRILLMQQLMERIVKCSVALTSTVPFKRIGVHSGGASSQIETEVLEEKIALAQYPDIMCPSIKKLEAALTDSISRGVDNVIYVTYHSLVKVLTVCIKLGIRPQLYCDEVHTAAGDKDKWEIVEQMCQQSLSYYAFSATVDKYRNKIEKIFGPRIYHLPANKAISLGLICQPQWMIAEVSGNRQKNLAQGVVQAFIEFSNRNAFDVKTLVNCNDTKDLKAIAGSKQVKSLHQSYPDFMLAEISSERGCIVNGKKVDRRAWIQAINSHDGPLMVLHIDICNAGIDVPGFNLPIWTYLPASETYQIQGNGRGARLSSVDRVLLEQGKLSANDRSKWDKPYNTVCLLAFEDTIEEDREAFVEFIYRSRDHGFKVNDLASSSKSSGKKSDPFNGSAGQVGIIQSIQASVDIALENESLREMIYEVSKLKNPMDIFEVLQ